MYTIHTLRPQFRLMESARARIDQRESDRDIFKEWTKTARNEATNKSNVFTKPKNVRTSNANGTCKIAYKTQRALVHSQRTNKIYIVLLCVQWLFHSISVAKNCPNFTTSSLLSQRNSFYLPPNDHITQLSHSLALFFCFRLIRSDSTNKFIFTRLLHTA